MKDQMSAIEESVTEQLKISRDIVIEDSLDINTLAPRKVDWDLKKGIQPKLQVAFCSSPESLVHLFYFRN
jgi:hypothetical protein